MSYWPLNSEGETYIEALIEEATRPIPTDLDLLRERRATVEELRHETDVVARELLQFAIDQIDRELHERKESK